MLKNAEYDSISFLLRQIRSYLVHDIMDHRLSTHYSQHLPLLLPGTVRCGLLLQMS